MYIQKAGPANEALVSIRAIVDSPGKSYHSVNDLLAVVLPLADQHSGEISVTEYILFEAAACFREFVATLNVDGDTVVATAFARGPNAFEDRVGAFARMQALYTLFSTSSLDDIVEESPETTSSITY